MKAKPVKIPKVQVIGPKRVSELTRVHWIALGYKLRLKRQAAKLTQIELANHVGCANDLISRLEKGGRVLRPILLEILHWAGIR